MKKRRSQAKFEDTVEACKEILKYFSKTTQVPVEFQDFSDKKTLQDLKFSFQQILVNYLLQFPNPAAQEHEKGLNLWKIGTRFLNYQISSAKEKGQLDVVGEGKEWVEPVVKKSRTRGKSEKVESLDFGQKYALVQKGVEGNFFFTSPVSRLIDDYHVDTNAAKIKIEPTPSLSQDQVAKLGSVAGSTPKQPPGRKIKRGVKIYPADFPEYGAFHSFAPSVDLGRSNLSRIESISSRYAGRKVFIEVGPKDVEFPVNIYKGDFDASLPQLVSLPTEEELDNLTMNPEDVDVEFLKEYGVELDYLLDSKKDMDICELDELELLARNVNLIKKLMVYQDERIRKGSENVTAPELEAADSLKSNLSKITSLFKPKDLVSLDQIRKAISALKRTERAFRGGLSQQTPFVFPCNTAGNGVIPAGSGTVPLALLKDRRRND